MQENVNNNEEKETEAEHNSKEEEEPTTELKLKGQHHLIELRRARVTELWAQGWSQQRIAEQLHVDQTSISLDIKWLKQQAREQIRLFVTEQLPSTVAKAKITLDLITQKLWQTVAQAERDRDEKTKMQALSLIQSAELQKIEIVSNTGIVDSVISACQ